MQAILLLESQEAIRPEGCDGAYYFHFLAAPDSQLSNFPGL